MIVLNRKKLLLITSCVFVGIFTFLITTTDLQETVETVSLPVSGKVIVVDAGHRCSR